MSYKQNPLVVNTNTSIHLPEDDIDMLFAQLQQIEPPQSLIARILAQVSQNTSSTQMFAQPLRLAEIDSWTTRTRQKNLC